MIDAVTIRNFKSIEELTLPLGRFNVLIGENGSGKTNILEALAMAACARVPDFGVDELFLRGVRAARPAMICSAFDAAAEERPTEVCFAYEGDRFVIQLAALGGARTARWYELSETLKALVVQRPKDGDPAAAAARAALLQKLRALVGGVEQPLGAALWLAPAWLWDFAVFQAVTPALRGTDVLSRRSPLGLHGEGLDVLLAGLAAPEFSAIEERLRVISWLDGVVVDRLDELKFGGHKLGRSASTLYFRDRFLTEDRALFSAENANEGVLHTLFHLALMVSAETPRFFAIDNLETSLNPRLCRLLTRELAQLAKAHDKQCLVTTHNPAVLDGLNLHDDDQRLFVVSRDDEGRTRARRIALKPESEAERRLLLSELWMRGHLGGIPKTF